MDARFSTRLQHAMHSAGLKQSDLIKLAQDQGVKLGKSQLSQYVSGKTVPRRDMLAALAGILQVDADWLRGAEVEPATIKPPAATPAAKTPGQDVSSCPEIELPTPKGTAMREFKKSSKLDNVLYDVRGPVVEEAARM